MSGCRGAAAVVAALAVSGGAASASASACVRGCVLVSVLACVLAFMPGSGFARCLRVLPEWLDKHRLVYTDMAPALEI